MNLHKMPPNPAQLLTTAYGPALNQQYKIYLLSSYLTTKSRNFKLSKIKFTKSVAVRNNLHREFPEYIHLVHSATTPSLNQNITEKPRKKALIRINCNKASDSLH